MGLVLQFGACKLKVCERTAGHGVHDTVVAVAHGVRCIPSAALQTKTELKLQTAVFQHLKVARRFIPSGSVSHTKGLGLYRTTDPQEQVQMAKPKPKESDKMEFDSPKKLLELYKRDVWAGAPDQLSMLLANNGGYDRETVRLDGDRFPTPLQVCAGIWEWGRVRQQQQLLQFCVGLKRAGCLVVGLKPGLRACGSSGCACT